MRHNTTSCVEMFAGNMWAGKTFAMHTILDSYAFQKHKVLCLENGYNTRNSDRDIQNVSKNRLYDLDVLKVTNAEEIIHRIDQYDIIAFDEVHLYYLDRAVYHDGLEDVFKAVFEKARKKCKKIYLASLLQDSNRDDEMFEILKDVIMLVDKIHIIPSSKKCYLCGGDEDVVFCVRQEGEHGKVGDHYDVMCYKCREKTKIMRLNYE